MQGKKYPSLFARFPPGSNMQHTYFCIVDNMQYIYIRDYKAGSTRNIPLQVWPMSESL